MSELYQKLIEFDAIREGDEQSSGDYIAKFTEENKPPQFVNDECMNAFFSRLQQLGHGNLVINKLKEYFEEQSINNFYQFQSEAINEIMDGNDVCIVTPTASCKTLCFNLPIIIDLLKNSHKKALYVYPMKALANDQRGQFEDLAKMFDDLVYERIDSWIYDGDTPNPVRMQIRQNPPKAIITNPEMLNQSMLGQERSWHNNLLPNIKYIVLDEIHEYRGFFGTNMAFLIRRLLLKLKCLGVEPQLILCSATCKNPDEHVRNLTGREFKIIRDESGMRPTRNYVAVGPTIPNYNFFEIYKLRIARSACALLSSGISTIIFCPSRKFVEEILSKSRREARILGLDQNGFAPYRAGYTADERRAIEEGLRNGRIKVIFSTNALEIGINIGRLDACLLAGFPDNLMSFQQRLGRAGRGWNRNAYILFYALNNPVDQFFCKNFESIFNKPLDELTVNLENDELIKKHLPCLMHEMNNPIESNEVEIFLGSAFRKAYDEVRNNFTPAIGHHGQTPHNRCHLRSDASLNYKLIVGNQEIGDLSDKYQFLECFPNAIYNHAGTKYRVNAIGAREIFLRNISETEADLRTEPQFFNLATSNDIFMGVNFQNKIALYYGKIDMYTNLTGYKVYRDHSDGSEEELDNVPMQESRLKQVHSFWMSLISSELFTEAAVQQGVREIEQLMKIGTMFVIPCDRYDLDSLNSTQYPQTFHLHETISGGIGLTEKIFQVWPEILKEGMSIAERCDCASGCPRCIRSNRYDQDVDSLDKNHGIMFAKILLNISELGATHKWDTEMYAWSNI